LEGLESMAIIKVALAAAFIMSDRSPWLLVLAVLRVRVLLIVQSLNKYALTAVLCLVSQQIIKAQGGCPAYGTGLLQHQ